MVTDQSLHAGVREILSFEFTGPPARRPLNECEPTEEMDSETAKVLAQAAEIAVAYSFGGPKRWRVVARLETKGVDLADSEKVHVTI